MKGMLSILLVADRHTHDLAPVFQAATLAARHADECDFMLVANGCSDAMFSAIRLAISGMENAKLIKLAAETDPDSAVMEGLQRAIGDFVFVGSVQDAAVTLIPPMLRLADEGHEVIVAEPRIGNTTIRLNQLDYGTRLMSRAAVHFVTCAGSMARSAYHLLPDNALFTPVSLPYLTPARPRASVTRGWRRRWRALVSSRIAPLRMVSLFALFGATVNITYSIYVLATYLLKEGVAPGWATLSLQSAGMNLLFSLALFVLCEYLINIFRANGVDQQVRVQQEIRSRTVSYDRSNLERA